MGSLFDLFRAVSAPVPTAPDDQTAAQSKPGRGGNPDAVPPPPSGAFGDLLSQIKQGRVLTDALNGPKDLWAVMSGKPLDDRQFLLEHGIELLQSLPKESKLGQKLSEGMIDMLWRDLPHPPATQVGPSRFREPDGSNNNIHIPSMGKAGSYYCRSVSPVAPKPNNLPEPGLIFDTLLKRDKFVPHPSGLSSLFFAFATIVIHECFQTNREDMWRNDTSSYVDLSTLYGNNAEEQKKVRVHDGSGRIWPDVIGSYRIFMMPPRVNAVLILFSRNHNHIADMLLKINESGTYTRDLEALDENQKKKQDDEIFHLARNVNVGFFASIVLRDYVNAILNTVRTGSDWNLDLGKEILKDGGRTDRGTGGAISVEFNMVYRWHASLSETDAKWTEDFFKSAFPKKDPADVTQAEFYRAAGTHEAKLKGSAPKDWEIPGLKRGADGHYDSDALANMIKDGIEEPGGAFKARGSPASFKVIETLGMIQARKYGVCTLNEFRKYLNLKTFESFTEWNSDPKIAAAAEALYAHVDRLELYPGLLAEEPKPPMPGSGVCVGHTIARGILDDAVALVRSDRFLTHDLNTYTLTSWGIAQLTPQPGAQGGLLSKVIFTALPNSFKGDSTYALFPFYTPPTITKIMRDLGKIDSYDTSRPPNRTPMKGINSYAGVKTIFNDRSSWENVYMPNLKKVTSGRGFMIGFEDASIHNHDKEYMLKALFPEGYEADIARFYSEQTEKVIKKKSVELPDGKTYMLDTVRDVFNVVPILYTSYFFGIPLKTEETPLGMITVHDLHLMLVALFVFTSFDLIDPVSWTLREGALKGSKILSTIIGTHLSYSGGWMNSALNLVAWTRQIWNKDAKSAWALSPAAEQFYKTLSETGEDTNALIANCVGSAIPLAGNLTQQAGLLLDLYLRPQYQKELHDMANLAKQNTSESNRKLMGYVREGMRIAPIVVGVPRKATKDMSFQDGDRTHQIKKGDVVLVSTSKAHLDPNAFPDPHKINPNRDPTSYMLMGRGYRYCLGAKWVGTSLVEVLKPILRLKNLRRATGPTGQLIRVPVEIAGNDFNVSIGPDGQEAPFPHSMSIFYDAET